MLEKSPSAHPLKKILPTPTVSGALAFVSEIFYAASLQRIVGTAVAQPQCKESYVQWYMHDAAFFVQLATCRS